MFVLSCSYRMYVSSNAKRVHASLLIGFAFVAAFVAGAAIRRSAARN